MRRRYELMKRVGETKDKKPGQEMHGRKLVAETIEKEVPVKPGRPDPAPGKMGAEPVLGRAIWSGTLSIGLVNVAVSLHKMTVDRSFSFHLLHRQDHQPLRYERICSKDGAVVPWEETVRGYEVRKGQFVVIEKDELVAAMPESDRKIHIDKFVFYLSLDPMYFARSYLLSPDRDPDAYHLLYAAFEQEGKAGVGRFTLRTREYPVVVHAYRGGLVLTMLRYADEVLVPSSFLEFSVENPPAKRDLDLAIRIIGDLSGDFAITDYHDHARDNIEQLIRKKMSGEVFVVEKPKEAETRELRAALEETLARLQQQA
jgi:DNA end-binding protein Ku